jgi:hypothetical protein
MLERVVRLDGVTVVSSATAYPEVIDAFELRGVQGLAASCLEERFDSVLYTATRQGLGVLSRFAEEQALDTGDSRDVTVVGARAYVATVAGLRIISLACEE